MSDLEPVSTLAERLAELHQQRLEVGCRSAEGRRITHQITALLCGKVPEEKPAFDSKMAQAGRDE